VLELSLNDLGPFGIRMSSVNLLEEFRAPRLVEPRPLDARERFCDCPRAPRVLLRPSSIVLVVDHEEEGVGREEEQRKKCL
jgi:hypothetical protein